MLLSPLLAPDFASYSYGQLSLMLALPSEKLIEITPDKSCGEIRKIKKAVKSEKKNNSAPAPALSPAPASALAPTPVAPSSNASNHMVYIVSWLYKNDPLKSATIQVSDDSGDALHNEIMVLLKNVWFDFGRNGDSISL